VATYIHIHAPQATVKRALATTCLDCKQRTRALCFYTPWYGWDCTCIKCGRNWQDGEWMPLTFEPQSRQKSIDRAKRYWRRLPPVSENHYGEEPTKGE
jgi:hypothetical protein